MPVADDRFGASENVAVVADVELRFATRNEIAHPEDDRVIVELRARAGDIPQVHEVAHSLKGIAGNVGASELREAASRMQTATETGETPATALLAAQFEEISAALERVREIHRTWAAHASNAQSIFA